MSDAKMAFWSGEKLLENRSVIVPFSDEQVDCNAYTLRMGNCYFRTADRESDHEQKRITLAGREAFLIPAGQFAYLLSKEEVAIPVKAMAVISMRTSIKFQGLINVSGFHVDPGYSGKLLYAVYNASPSPIQICENDKIFKIWFCDLDRVSERTYSGHAFNDISNDIIRGMSKEIFSLQSVADKIRNLENEINAKLAAVQPAIDYLTFTWRAIFGGVVASLVFAFLAFAVPVAWKSGQNLATTLWPPRAETLPPSPATAPQGPSEK